MTTTAVAIYAITILSHLILPICLPILFSGETLQYFFLVIVIIIIRSLILHLHNKFFTTMIVVVALSLTLWSFVIMNRIRRTIAFTGLHFFFL